MRVMKFRKKPVIVDAIQWDGAIETLILLQSMGMMTTIYYVGRKGISGLKIKTLEGEHIADLGDWIIKGIKGEFYPCKPDIFAATYEPVEECQIEPDPLDMAEES